MYKGEACRLEKNGVEVWFPLSPHVADLVVSGMRKGGGGGQKNVKEGGGMNVVVESEEKEEMRKRMR